MIALISHLLMPSSKQMPTAEPIPANDAYSCGSLSIEAAHEVICQFTDPQLICGSVSVVNADKQSLTEMALIVARWAQREYELQVGWYCQDAKRLREIAEQNHLEMFDTEILPLPDGREKANCQRPFQQIGLLIVDDAEILTPSQLQELDASTDAQIVLGLFNHGPSFDAGECFDQNLEITWAWN